VLVQQIAGESGEDALHALAVLPINVSTDCTST
jgi:hypothetical protein